MYNLETEHFRCEQLLENSIRVSYTGTSNLIPIAEVTKDLVSLYSSKGVVKTNFEKYINGMLLTENELSEEFEDVIHACKKYLRGN